MILAIRNSNKKEDLQKKMQSYRISSGNTFVKTRSWKNSGVVCVNSSVALRGGSQLKIGVMRVQWVRRRNRARRRVSGLRFRPCHDIGGAARGAERLRIGRDCGARAPKN